MTSVIVLNLDLLGQQAKSHCANLSCAKRLHLRINYSVQRIHSLLSYTHIKAMLHEIWREKEKVETSSCRHTTYSILLLHQYIRSVMKGTRGLWFVVHCS